MAVKETTGGSTRVTPRTKPNIKNHNRTAHYKTMDNTFHIEDDVQINIEDDVQINIEDDVQINIEDDVQINIEDDVQINIEDDVQINIEDDVQINIEDDVQINIEDGWEWRTDPVSPRTPSLVCESTTTRSAS
jgi:hypothetical protein